MRGKVLIIDDEPAMCRSLKSLLGDRHDVSTAPGGEETLKLLEGGATFDVLLCDLMMPGLSCSVGDQIAALARVAPAAPALIREVPDPAVWAIVRTWPRAYQAARARDLGFVAETSFDDIIAAHLADEGPV